MEFEIRNMKSLKTTLIAWPVVTAVTIGLCCLTQLVGGWFGIELKEQANLTAMREMFARAFESWRVFGFCALNIALILVICPILEEAVFRWLLYKKVSQWLGRSAFGQPGSDAHSLSLAPRPHDSAPDNESTNRRIDESTNFQLATAEDNKRTTTREPTAVPPSTSNLQPVLQPSTSNLQPVLQPSTSNLQPVLQPSTSNLQPALVALVASALFSAAHYVLAPWPDNAFFALFFFGFAQCWLYQKTERLWCVVLNHALFNLTNLVLMFFVKV